MSIHADGSNAPALTGSKGRTIKDLLVAEQESIKAVLQNRNASRFIASALLAINQDYKLADCTPISLLAAIKTSATLGLEVGGPLGQAFLIPYKDRKTGQSKASFQLGYKGLLDLCRRSKEIQTIGTGIVREGDEFRYKQGFEPVLDHVPMFVPEAKIRFFYAYAILVNGGKYAKVMTLAEVEKHRDRYSQSYRFDKNNSPWESDFEPMGQKTVLMQLLKILPVSVEETATDEVVEQQGAMVRVYDADKPNLGLTLPPAVEPTSEIEGQIESPEAVAAAMDAEANAKDINSFNIGKQPDIF